MESTNFDDRLFDIASSDYILGYMMRHPAYFRADGCKYNLNLDDFDGIRRIIFAILFNLIHAGADMVCPKDLEREAGLTENLKREFERNSGRELAEQMYAASDTDDQGQFDLMYSRVKKLSLLRGLKAAGIDISEFYDGKNFLAQDEQKEKLYRTPSESIISRIKKKIEDVENKNCAHAEETGADALVGMRELVGQFRSSPEVGFPIQAEILNYATRGCRKGKLYMYSSSQGGGKTRTMVGMACDIAYPRIENGEVIVPQNLAPVLFIATEMQLDEIQTLVISHISGVNEENILLGRTSPDEERLIETAIRIMERYPNHFRIECLTDPTIKTVRSRITSFVINSGIEYVFYDYIFNSPGLTSEFGNSGLREDKPRGLCPYITFPLVSGVAA